MSLDNLQTIWAELLIDSLAQCGVRHAVISPGSRSTPLTLAAARHLELEAIAVIDERSAAFFALGLARSRGETPLLICTSGSAAAHYFPAVIEACSSRLPLLILTADRPPDLQHRGAAQTIDQRHLFGSFVRHSYELGLAQDSDEAWRGLRSTAARAVAQAQTRPCGPVHLNAAFRKPLEPQVETPADLVRRGRMVAISHSDLPQVRPSVLLPDAGALADAASRLASASRGLVVAGAALPNQAAIGADALAGRLGWPLFADSTSQLRRAGASTLIAFHELLLRTPWAAGQRPDLVLVLGNEPGGIGWGRWSEALRDVPVLMVAADSLPDPDNHVSQWLAGDVRPTVQALTNALGNTRDGIRTDTLRWRDGWLRADREAFAVTMPSGDPSRPLSEPDAVHAVAAALSAAQALMLGNSLPVRSIDLFAAPSDAAVVLHQRGANGIDGLIAGAAAVAQPATLLLGDVAFLHDLGSLATAREHAEALTVVVLDNEGGRIFDQLPIAALPEFGPVFERFFRTPPRLDIAEACAAFGIACRRVSTPLALREAMREPAEAPCRVIWAEVEPDSAERVLRQRVAALDERLGR